MDVKYQIGGYATVHGVIMINASKCKVAWAVRNAGGTVSVKEMKAVNKYMTFYRSKIEGPVGKIPAIREIFRMSLMFTVMISALISGIVGALSPFGKWSSKRVFSIILVMAGLYVSIFMNDYATIVAFIILIAYFNRELEAVLKYHGAEHKCVNMYDSIDDSSDLTVDNAKDYPRTHLRCGTNIIFLMVPLSILLYVISLQWLKIMAAGSLFGIVGGLLLLGISIELFKLFQKPLMQWVLKPGILLQRFVTTREPDKEQLEVAIKALEAVL